jgi:hypothetical protein
MNNMEYLNSILDWVGKLEPEVWVAIAAMFLSVVVISQNRKHNRLSVKPNIDVHRNLQGGPHILTLLNSGVGPAIIETLAIEVDGEKYRVDSFEGMDKFSRKYPVISSLFLEPGSYLSAGQSRDIVTFNPTFSERSIAAMSLTIEWKSIYNEKFKIKFSGHNE